MKLSLKNIGPISNAELELGKLTVICGKNNQGKTYLAYSLYGLLKTWSDYARFDIPLRVLQKLRTDGLIKFNLKEFENQILQVIHNIAKNYSENLNAVFSANKLEFKESIIDIILDDFQIDYSGEFHSTMSRGNREYLQAVKEKDSDELIFTLSKEHLEIPSTFMSRDIGKLIGAYFFRKYFPNPFLISSERTGVQLFQRELDIHKNVLLETIIKSQKNRNIDPFEFIKETVSRYSTPVKDNIDFVRDIDQITKQSSYLLEKQPDLAKSIEAMLNVEFKFQKGQASIVVKKGKGKKNLPFYLTSTSVRAMSDLSYYIKHKAQIGDILIVDEPEINLHPENQIKIARLFARLVNNGIKILITTHSDYIIKELNNLVMLNNDFEDKSAFLRKYNYQKEERLKPNDLRVYIVDEGSVINVEIDKYGMINSSFDSAIDIINTISSELSFKINPES